MLSAGLLLALLAGFAPPKAYADAGASDFRKGQAAEQKDDIDAAYEYYLKAHQKSPEDDRYRVAFERMKFADAALHTKRGEKLRDQGDYTGAMTEYGGGNSTGPPGDLGGTGGAERDERDVFAGAVAADLERAAHPEHGAGQQSNLPDGGQGGGH